MPLSVHVILNSNTPIILVNIIKVVDMEKTVFRNYGRFENKLDVPGPLDLLNVFESGKELLFLVILTHFCTKFNTRL